ncbi:MAG: hypothetical protein JSS86_00125 [Cyanobacteria bacterium SZAS LIN-2]|nr:hypothetical protein [Cyanobacteria bacterium SZAS LIN-2]
MFIRKSVPSETGAHDAPQQSNCNYARRRRASVKHDAQNRRPQFRVGQDRRQRGDDGNQANCRTDDGYRTANYPTTYRSIASTCGALGPSDRGVNPYSDEDVRGCQKLRVAPRPGTEDLEEQRSDSDNSPGDR